MVLRSSPWESRTPPATKGHFARGGPLRESGGGLLLYGAVPQMERGPSGPRRPLGPLLRRGNDRGQPLRPERRGVTGPWERAVTRCVARLTAVYMRRLHRGESR